MIAGTLLSTPDMWPGPFFLGDDGGMSRYWYDFGNNVTGVTMEVATYKGMYAAKMYSPAENTPHSVLRDCCQVKETRCSR